MTARCFDCACTLRSRAAMCFFPDLQGCFSSGDRLDAAVAWIHAALDAGGEIPPRSPFDALRRRPDCAR